MQEKKSRGILPGAQRVLIGFSVAFGIVALFAALVFYLIPTFFHSGGPGWSVVEGESISVYYLQEDLPDFNPRSYLSRVSDAEQAIATKLSLKESEIPDKIRIYVHKDLSALKQAIADRKSSSDRDVPLAVMDIIAGHEFKPVFVRLLTTFAWGKPSSEFLRLGLQSYFSDRLDEPHLRAAGLGKYRFSLSEINSLAKTDNIPRSLHDKIYDSFDSPNAAAGMSLSVFSTLLRSRFQELPYRYELEAEASSFVSYLIDQYGIDHFRALWNASSLLGEIERIYGLPRSGLEQNWLDFIQSRGEDNPLVRYYRARTSYSRGRFTEALTDLNTLEKDGFSEKKAHFLRGRLHFYRGEWDKADKSFALLKEENAAGFDTRVDAYRELIQSYISGEKLEERNLATFAPGSIKLPSDLTDKGSRVLDKAEMTLPRLNQTYPRIRVFISTEEGEGSEWARISIPESVSVVSDLDNYPLKVSEILVAGMSRTPTYSNLLRRGLIHYLAMNEVFSAGREVLIEKNWEPVSGLTVNLDPNSTSSKISATFVGYLLSQFGRSQFEAIWESTTPLGGDWSLDSALNKETGLRLDQVEEKLKAFLWSGE
ncbi:MAG: hypothetical protein ACOC6I_02590 [Candidatus Bipolaricaulota bacterium]